MKKKIIVAIVCYIFVGSLFGQSNQVLFSAEIQSASVDLQDQQYRSAIKHAEKAKTYLGQDSTTTQIEYILTKSYIGLGYFDDAKTSLKRYFNIAKEGDFGYNEMLLLLSRIDDMEEETKTAEEAQKTQAKDETEAWDRAVKINTTEAYQSFAAKFPQSIHATEANKLANNQKIQSQLTLEKTLLEQKRKGWKNRKKARGFLLGFGIPIAFLGITDLVTPTFRGATLAVGSTMTLTSLLFVHPRKYKKRYQKQLEVVNNLEKGLMTDSGRLSPHWQIGMSVQRPGLTLCFNF